MGMLPATQRAGGFLRVKLMFLIMCEELIRNGRSSAQAGARQNTGSFHWFCINRSFTQGSILLETQYNF